jgi:hypothetical protein
MDDVEKSQQKTVELLKSIQNVDDLKEHKDEIFKAIIDMLKFGLQALKTFFEVSLSMSDEEKQNELAKYQDDRFLFTEEIDNEMERISSLPGAEEYLDNFQEEMEKQMGPYMEEITEQMAKLMGSFMGDLMDGIAEGFGDMAVVEPEEEEKTEPEVKEEFKELYFFNHINSLDDLKDSKEYIFYNMEEKLIADWDLLMAIKDDFFPPEESSEKIAEVDNRHKVIDDELQSVFARFDALPDAKEYVKTFKEEMMTSFKPKITEIRDLLDELKKVDIEKK